MTLDQALLKYVQDNLDSNATSASVYMGLEGWWDTFGNGKEFVHRIEWVSPGKSYGCYREINYFDLLNSLLMIASGENDE